MTSVADSEELGATVGVDCLLKMTELNVVPFEMEVFGDVVVVVVTDDTFVTIVIVVASVSVLVGSVESSESSKSRLSLSSKVG